MGDELEPIAATDGSDVLISHRRILITMAAVIVFGTIAGLIFISASVGFGVFIGGLLAYANYFWQKHSIKAIFDRAVHGHKPRFLALRYLLRYVALGGVLTLIYFTQTVSIFAVIFGLSSFAAAVMIEGLTSTFRRDSN
jgi:hypothetical protein